MDDLVVETISMLMANGYDLDEAVEATDRMSEEDMEKYLQDCLYNSN